MPDLSLNLDAEGKHRLKQFMESAMRQLREAEDIRESLKDLSKKVGEELDIKPAQLMKAAKVNYKDKREEERETANLIDEIIEATQ